MLVATLLNLHRGLLLAIRDANHWTNFAGDQTLVWRLVGQLWFSKSFCATRLKGERGNSVVTTWSGDAPGAMGAGPTGEVVPFEPDQAFTHASPAFCVRLGLKLGGDERNTSRERGR